MTDTFAGLGSGPARSLAPLLERIIERIALRLVPANLLGQLEVISPSGRSLMFGQPGNGAPAQLHIKSWRVIARAIQRGGNGFAESYIRNEIDSPDLTALIGFFARNKATLVKSGGKLFTSRGLDRLAHLVRRNTKSGSRRNIAAHYDLGNGFYETWLDATMTYSAGLFTSGDESLEEAQEAKYATILEALNVAPGGKVLEIGCGWGGFAEHALSNADIKLEGVTLSAEQLAFAQARLKCAGLAGRADLRFQDYRATSGSYDAIVSIEMVEAVGEENWPTYFQTLSDRLKPGGHAVLQAITIAPEHFVRYRRKADFIQRYIFPGGMLPTFQLMQSHAEQAGLRAELLEQFPSGYARTLQIWRDVFEAKWAHIERQGFDEKFRRMWLYYLAYCEAAFAENLTSVGIYRFTKPAGQSKLQRVA